MDDVTKYALELIEEEARRYRRVLEGGMINGHHEVTLNADALAMPLEAIASKIRTRQDERDRIVIA